MITWMQKHRKYLIVTIWISTIAFVGAGFVGWGAYSYGGDKASSVATVGDRAVLVRDFQLAYSNIYNYYNNMMKGQLSQEKAKKLGLENIVLNKLIDEAVLLSYADELGLMATEEEIKDKLKSIPNFNENGVFKKELYYRIIKQMGIKTKEYEKSLEKEIILTKVQNIFQTPITNLEKEVISSAISISDKLEIKVIENNSSDINISENELKAYWLQNKSKYQTTKSFSLNTLDINIKDMVVDEAKMREYFDRNKHKYKDNDGKLKDFNSSKKLVEKDYRFKLAKNKALIKYSKFKKGKIKSETKLVIFANDREVKFDKLNKAKKNDFIKPIKLKNRYIVSQLESVNFPEPMKYEAAREKALRELKKKKNYLSLEKKAKALVGNFKGIKTKYLTRDDGFNITNLNPFEGRELLNIIFDGKGNGYKIFPQSNKIVLYKIIDQKLFDSDKLKKNEKVITENIKQLKELEVNKNIISLLKQRYKIVKYFKGE